MIPRQFRSAGVVGSLILVASAIEASPVLFTDVYDPDAIRLDNRNTSITFIHDIVDDGFNPLTDTLIAGAIFLDVRDDGDAAVEKVRFELDGEDEGTFRVSGAGFLFLVNVALLQSDGKLAVTITRRSGDFIFDDSTLVVEGDRADAGLGAAAHMPEPGTLFILGIGVTAAAFAFSFRKR